MARYKGGVSGAAPLQIQITTTASCPAVVVAFSAMGDNSSGSASRPALSRPATPGTGTGTVIPLDPASSTAQTSVVTSFSGAPSTPGVSSGAFNLPLRLRWAASPSRGVVVPVSSSLLLYAAASGGHTWTGELVWEEK